MARELPTEKMQQTGVDRIYRKKEVLEITGISNSNLYDLMARNNFPRPISLGGPRAKGWLSSELIGWINERIKERDNERSLQHKGKSYGTKNS